MVVGCPDFRNDTINVASQFGTKLPNLSDLTYCDSARTRDGIGILTPLTPGRAGGAKFTLLYFSLRTYIHTATHFMAKEPKALQALIPVKYPVMKERADM